ncbi:hypothetical protein [Streptomyces sp. CRN 30]|uniref:hypothetical protein n=1 Tax=Streptomyces sp. CRN 30 TaxID=3075613 RepID=UPI002A82DFC9|nr:hypothetical protein [Streptomyces sp. CRN 30]
MHMNSVPQHLSSEDRKDYERVLDEALRSAPHRPELAAMGQRLNSEQLRTMALSATALITAAAATEYQHYVKVREELRQPAPSAPQSSVRESSSTETSGNPMGLAATMGEVAETAGAGAVAVVAVLAPVLAGTAAAIFLLVGYVLKMIDPEQAFARTLLTTGWVFGGVTAVAILVAAAGLLTTALRNRPSAEAVSYGERDGVVRRARDAWHTALLEQGIVPFLRDALADPAAATATGGTAPSEPSGRIPQLGYGRPGFSSPDDGTTAGHRPKYSSPDFSSPDWGGPEHQPE